MSGQTRWIVVNYFEFSHACSNLSVLPLSLGMAGFDNKTRLKMSLKILILIFLFQK